MWQKTAHGPYLYSGNGENRAAIWSSVDMWQLQAKMILNAASSKHSFIYKDRYTAGKKEHTVLLMDYTWFRATKS